MRFGILSTRKQIFRSLKPEIFSENVQKPRLNYQRINRKLLFLRHPPFLWCHSFWVKALTCLACFNLSHMICQVPLSLKKRSTPKKDVLESLFSKSLTLNSRSLEPLELFPFLQFTFVFYLNLVSNPHSSLLIDTILTWFIPVSLQ